ncbi:MAG: methionine adenosyltransferase [Caldiserica bacterium]|nr:MAG: methionine adenosyltransferase [Caldisericota bacterium]
MKSFLFTSESVGEGHPDKVCDQISDAVLDEVLKFDLKEGLKPYRLKPEDKRGSRVACETFITVGLVIVGGEITTEAWVDVHKVVRDLLKDIGYTGPEYGFDYKTCAILNAIGPQSPDIAMGVDTGGAGDQGLMIGYACKETEELMPLPIILAHKLVLKQKEVRKNKEINYLGPDCKSQVTVEYIDGKPRRVKKVVLSTQHTIEATEEKSGKKVMSKKAKEEIVEKIVKTAIPEEYLEGFDFSKDVLINPTGLFLVGGPQSDTGMTGRKIIVDTYGGMALHGGGAFSGKDPTKVDRSATYAARYVAKNIVASGVAEKCTVQIAYAIGVRDPIAIMIDTHGTGKVNEEKLIEVVNDVFDLTPSGIIEMLDLWKPIYRNTACFGHFGRNEFPWEKTDKVPEIRGKLGI